MARKFWERVGGNQIRFYDEPLNVKKDETQARILEIQEILAAPDHMKAIIAQANPAVTTEAEFEKLFTDELEELAERLDYWDFDVVQETIDFADSGWFKPADGQLGPGVVLAVCGEETGFEAGLAIDGLNGTNWQHDHNHDGEPAPFHDLVFDLGYKARIDRIRINTGPTPGNAVLLSGVQVFIANSVNGLQGNPKSHVGVDLEFSDPADIVNDFIERDLVARSGRYIQIRIASTGSGQNHITLRDIQIRKRARTFGL